MRIRLVIILFIASLFTPGSVVPSTIKKFSRTNQTLSPGVFLVATHELEGSFFSHSVILLAKYNHEGALGVIINRPSGIDLSEALPDFKWLKKNLGTLFIGGPVSRFSPFMLLRSKNKIKNTYRIFSNTSYSMDIRSIVDFILKKDSNGRVRVYAGYTGWHPGQLEAEVASGSWRVIKADQYSIFDKDPDILWEDLMRGGSPLIIKHHSKNFMVNYLTQGYL